MVLTSPDDYVQGILQKKRRVLAKTITLMESRLAADQQKAQLVLEKLLTHTGKSIRLGITGVPGAGKSTFIESLGMDLVNQGHQVAVLAVDPSSRRSGGSILGDKTRMEKLSSHENAFIRPSPAGDTLGGVAAKTREIMLVCEAAGFDVILVETVGVGQSETQVASMVDFFLLLMIAGAGDELQGIKKGIIELADGIAINKADSGNEAAVRKAKLDLKMALHLMGKKEFGWETPVKACSSITPGGTGQIWQMVLDHRKLSESSGLLEQRRQEQSLEWMWTLVEDGLRQRFKQNETVRSLIPEISRQVRDGTLSASFAARQLLSYM